MSDKVFKKIVSSFLSVIIGVSSLAISPLTVSAVTSETNESTSTVQNENITVKWLYEDNSYYHGSSFAIDENFSVTNSVGLNIAYDIQKVRDGGYEPNELVITVQGIGDIYRKSTLQASSVGADKMTATTKTHDWSYSYDGSEDIYTFTNNKKIDGNSVLNGYFDLIWNLRSTETVNDYRQDNIQATMKFSENGIVHSNLLTLTNKTYCDTYQGWFTANRLSSSKGMNVDNPSEYIFVRYNLDYNYTSKSRTLKSPERETYTFDVDTENIGSGALICTTDKSLKVLSVHENNTYTIEKSKTKGNLYVAYPKSEYLGKTVNTEYKAVGTFEDEEEQTTLFSTGKTISMDDFLQFADTSGDFYYYSKSLYSGKSYDKDKNTIYGRTLEKGNTVQYALATGMATVNHTGISELGKEVKISDTETGKYIGYTFDLYDDMQYARQVNGEYRKLTSDEYNIVSVKIPSVYQIDGQNDTAIQPHQYPVKIYVSTDGTHITKSDDSLIYSGYIETFEKTVTLPENTTDILISVEQLSEVCCMFFYVDVAYHIDSNNNDEDIDLISGELVNFSALKIYADLLHNQIGRIEKKWIDSNTENPKYTLSQTDIEEFTPEKMELYDNKEFYPNRLLSRVTAEGNPYKDSYTSTTKLSEIQPVQNHFESQLQIGGTFLFIDDVKPNKFSVYTVLPRGISLKDCHRTEQLWDLINLSGMGLNSETLSEHCTAEMIANYRNSGQVYLALHFNFENTDLLPDKTDTVSGISTYTITATLPLSITKGVIRKNPSVVIRSALEFDNTENYKTSTVGVPDNGKWSNDTELFSDINNNGKTDDNLVTSYDYRNKANADYSQFQLQKFVKSDYTGDYVSTEENPVVSYGSDYSYRLELTNGSRQLTNIVLTDILENEPNSQWKGIFQSAELDTDLDGTIYYSEKTDPDNNLLSADWTTEKGSSIKAIAVHFGNSVLKSGKTIGVVIHMKAESNSNFKNTFSENKCSLSVVTVEDDSNKFDLISNATKIRLVPALYDIIVTKEDSQTSEKLNGAEFTLYDENNNKVRSLKTNAKGYAIFTDIPSDTVYTLKETKAPKGYERNINNETVTLDGDYRITVRNERKKGTVQVIKSNSLATDVMVEGAEYSIINEKGDIIANAVTDENGVAVFDNLLWGKYTVRETQSPDGYKLNNKEYTVEINRNNADEPVIVLASDEQSKEITVHLTKYEALTDSTPTETVLPRSTFRLFRMNVCEVKNKYGQLSSFMYYCRGGLTVCFQYKGVVQECFRNVTKKAVMFDFSLFPENLV